jgi:hypothetical protein
MTDNFDRLVPGQKPTGWEFRWGKHDDEKFMVTNIECVSPPNSLMVDRTQVENGSHWGFAVALPDVASGWAHLAFEFRTDSPGEERGASFELRGKVAELSAPVVSLELIQARLDMTTRNRSLAWNERLEYTSLGEISQGVWYRVELWMPTSGGQQREMQIRLLMKNPQEGGPVWTTVGEVRKLKAIWPQNGYGDFYVNMGINKRTLLYLDDVLWSRAEQPEPKQ